MVADTHNPFDTALTLVLPGGKEVLACKAALASRASFFAPMLEEPGHTALGEAELSHLATALAPGAYRALPTFLAALGGREPPQWQALFEGEGVLHAFAIGHLLGCSELMEAARQSAAEQRRLMEALAALDADADGASLRLCADFGLCGQRRLLHAAAAADAEAAARVLMVDADLELRDEEGRTALQVCAVHDSAAVARLLAEASAALDALCDAPEEEEMEEGSAPGLRTALHLAALHDGAEVARVLLEAKADAAACVKGPPGAVTPLHEAADADSARTVAILAAAAAAEMARRVPEAPPPELPVEEVGPTPVPMEDDGEVKWESFPDALHAKVGPNGSTPLHTAAQADAANATSALLQARADVNMGDEQGDSPLHCAVLYGSPNALAVILANGGDAAKENGSGELPLHLMAEFGPGNDDGEQPPALARRHFAKSMKAQNLLLEALQRSGKLAPALGHAASGDSGNTALHAVARWDHLGARNAAELLAKAKADLERRNAEGRTAMAIAVRRYGRDGHVVKVLREHGAQEPAQADVDPLAGALGGCVRPLVFQLPTGQPRVEDATADMCD